MRKQARCSLRLVKMFCVRTHVIINLAVGGRRHIGKNVFINDDTKINARESIT